MKMIEVNNVSMRFNMAKEKHESLKEYFLAAVQASCSLKNFTRCAMFPSPCIRVSSTGSSG